MKNSLYDLQRLGALRDALATLDVAAAPTAKVLFPASLPPLRRIGLLCGSFNPLTLAHTELAEQARLTAGLDLVLFTLAKVTVDKERVTGLSLVDRLLLLSFYAQRRPQLGVALVNRGLYFEQAQAFRSLLGDQVVLFFVVGMDKLVQILDPKYYQDRDAALRQLFALTSLIVANRGAMARMEFDQVLDRSENQPYRSSIHFCSLSNTVAELSATTVREELAASKIPKSVIPEETTAFLEETKAFYPPVTIGEEKVDVYDMRQQVLHSLLADVSPPYGKENFQALFQRALSASEEGKMLRRALSPADQ